MIPAAEDQAILRTLLYADVFDYPLTLTEIQHYLIALPASPEAVRQALETSPWLVERVTRVNGYFAVRDREEIGWLRDERQRNASALWPSARRWGYLVGCLPFVRMVAVTGALAVNNSPSADDVDLLIVTTPGRVWLSRAFAIALVYLARRFGVELCPNYVLSQTALVQVQRNLFAAHDLAQMVPLVGHRVYTEMRAANGWAGEYLPHAVRPLHVEAELTPAGVMRLFQWTGERLLSGWLGDILEAWERGRKMRKFSPAAGRANSAAQLDQEHVKGHFDDYAGPVLQRFAERLERYLQ